MDKQGAIYKIENLINKKVYIGQTVKKPQRRFQAHRSLLKRNIHDNDHLQKAWNRYGEENFKFEIIENYPLHELDNIEIELISKYRKINKCYNLESGGNSQKELSESTKNKLSKSIKDLHENNKEYRLKFLEGRARKIICINTGGIYNSIVEASEDFNINYTNIHQVCCGNSNSARGCDGNYYQFAYYEKGKEYKLIKLENINTPRNVVCVNTGEVFKSTVEASNKTKIQQSHISNCCNGTRNFAGRMQNGDWIKWVFEDDYNPAYNYTFQRKVSITTRNKMSVSKRNQPKKIVLISATNIKTKEVLYFSNVDEAIQYIREKLNPKVAFSGIYRCLKNERKTAYGFEWEYA